MLVSPALLAGGAVVQTSHTSTPTDLTLKFAFQQQLSRLMQGGGQLGQGSHQLFQAGQQVQARMVVFMPDANTMPAASAPSGTSGTGPGSKNKKKEGKPGKPAPGRLLNR